jgi:hypothetical protein
MPALAGCRHLYGKAIRWKASQRKSVNTSPFSITDPLSDRLKRVPTWRATESLHGDPLRSDIVLLTLPMAMYLLVINYNIISE